MMKKDYASIGTTIIALFIFMLFVMVAIEQEILGYISFVAIIIGFVFLNMDRRDKMEKADFLVIREIRTRFYDHFLVDEANKKIGVYRGFKLEIFDFKDIVSYSLEKDGKTYLGSRALETAIGGLAFGTLGAFIGSAGKRQVYEECHSLTIYITVKDMYNPTISIDLIRHRAKTSSMRYKKAVKRTREILAILEIIEKMK